MRILGNGHQDSLEGDLAALRFDEAWAVARNKEGRDLASSGDNFCFGADKALAPGFVVMSGENQEVVGASLHGIDNCWNQASRGRDLSRDDPKIADIRADVS